ncbi:diguanylate cyclase [Argonema galeatum]|uniref:diguanylate cyclase n=1 Tax=Argonema galeatum TaxID=2942762 RepID=UPI00201362B8|nr:diguanylate cyclase [Argonema galeatum]MCL1466973.1 diguanylate cyclase [Argonema galeatum A003/A1]
MNSRQNFTSKTKILVVDDTPENIRLLIRILSNQGYKLRVALNGKLALESIRANPPDLILLDIKMPDMDGYEVCRQLKASEQSRDIPVIFISASDAIFNKVKAFTMGGVDYITKPFEHIEVLVRIEHQLRLRLYQLQLQRQNAQLQLLLTTTQAISSATDVEEALEVIVTNVCQTLGWEFGQAWMPSPDATVLEYVGGWYGGDVRLDEFRRQSETFRFAPGEGLPGRIWLSQKFEWIADVTHEKEQVFLRLKIAAEAGIKGALGIPIVFDRQVLAVLVFFQNQEMIPNERSQQLVNAIATQLGSMIQRKKAEAALQKSEEVLRRLANLDGLTQIANRRRFDEYLNAEWKRLKREIAPLSLILLDVDFFKSYNDTYGHLAGDDCLRLVADTIKSAIQRPEDLVARYGGEEFAVILPNTDASGSVIVAEAIRQAIHDLAIPHAQSRVCDRALGLKIDRLTVSLGVASTVPKKGLLPQYLINAADKALYTAKKEGRDRVALGGECIISCSDERR